MLELSGRGHVGAARPGAEVLGRGEGLPAPTSERGAQVVLDFGLGQQLLEHLVDVEVLLGGHLDVAVLPFGGDESLGVVRVHLRRDDQINRVKLLF